METELDNITDIGKKRLEKLAKDGLRILNEVSENKNRFHIKSFVKKYGMLYKKYTKEELRNDTQLSSRLEILGKQFAKDIDLYRPIKLIGDNGEELIELPPVFLKLKALNEENRSVSDAIRSLANSNLFPKQYEELTMRLLGGLIKSQSDDATPNYIDYLRSKKKQYSDMIENVEDKIKDSKEKEVEESDGRSNETGKTDNIIDFFDYSKESNDDVIDDFFK